MVFYYVTIYTVSYKYRIKRDDWAAMRCQVMSPLNVYFEYIDIQV